MVLVVLSWMLLVAMVVRSCLLLLLVLKEAPHEVLRPGVEKGCDFGQALAAQNSKFPCEGCDCALFFWQWLQWNLRLCVWQSCGTVLRQFLQRLGR